MKKVTLFFLSFYTLFFSAKFIAAEPFEEKPNFTFTENKGQVSDQYFHPRPDVLFTAAGRGLDYYLRNTGISYQLSRVDSWQLHANKRCGGNKIDNKVPAVTTIYRVDVTWQNMNPNFTLQYDDALQGYNNYYSEVCPNGVHGVKTYKGVTYKNIYPQINLHYYERNGNLKYDYIVAPGADYKKIQFVVEGATAITVNAVGELELTTPLGRLTEQAPLVTQGGKQLGATWVVNKNTISFDIKNVDPSQELMIDPVVRLWATYVGGNSYDDTWIAVCDASNNVYLTGQSTSGISNIATVGAYQFTYGGSTTPNSNVGDAILIKYNSSGVKLWGTYYGGNGDDIGQFCLVDASGDIYLSGNTTTTNSAVMSTSGTHQQTIGGGNGAYGDGFLAKFTASGMRIWGTYFGGSGFEWNYASCLDPSGNIYVGGQTSSSVTTANDIATPGAHQTIYGGNTSDGFLMKFNSSGNRLWGSYYGGASIDDCRGLTCDPSGNVYLSGWTASSAGITTPGSHQSAYTGISGSAMVAKFNAGGTRLWGTYIGGSGWTFAQNVVVDASGDFFVSGQTASTNTVDIATAGAHQANFGGGASDAFLMKFSSQGVRQWGTYYGGSGDEENTFCCIDKSGNLFIFGTTTTPSGTAIASACSYQLTNGGGMDAFFAKFTSSGTRLSGSYYGGNGTELWVGGTTDAANYFYLSGASSSSVGAVIASAGSDQPAYGGGPNDGFLAKFDFCSQPVNTTALPDLVICAGETTTLTTLKGCGNLWLNSQGTPIGTGSAMAVSPAATATYYVGESGCGPVTLMNATPLTVTVTNDPLPVISVVNNNSIMCLGQTATLNVSGANTYTWTSFSWTSGISAPSIIVTPTASTTYTVRATGPNDCIGTQQATQQVYNCLGLGDEGDENLELMIYPNPNKGDLIVETNRAVDAKFINMLGQPVLKVELQEGKNKLDLNQQPRGVYFVETEYGVYKVIRD